MADVPERSDGDEPSLAELAEQLGRDSSRLALHEAALSASRHVPELRRIAVGTAAVVAIVLAFLSAFALANWAAVEGLSSVLPGWLAALLVAAAWLVVGIVLVAIVRARLLRGSTGVWLRVLGDDRSAAVVELETSRDEAEQAVRATLDGLGVAMAAAAVDQLADAIVPLADDIGEELLEATEDVVEAIAENVPGAGAIGEFVEIVLIPGRFGLRVVTTLFRGSSNDDTR